MTTMQPTQACKYGVVSTSAQIVETPIETLDIGWERFRLVRPREYATMRDSIKQYGQISPATVGRAMAVPQCYELIDGFKRYRACMELGIATMKIQVLGGSIHALKAAIVNLNRGQGTLHAFEEALVVRSLHRDDLLTQQQIATLLGRHKSWACRRIALSERLCEEAIEHIRLGLIGFATSRELWRLPRGNQPEALACILKHRLNSRETAQLVSRLMQSPRWEHENILHMPLDILDTRRPPRPPDAPTTCVRLCTALENACVCIEAAKTAKFSFDATQRGNVLGVVDRSAMLLAGLKAALEEDGHVY
jgi:ParB/RepB/Spo0J family partition protein